MTDDLFGENHDVRVAHIEANLREVRKTILEHGGTDATVVVGVTKGQPVETIAAACDAGITLFGENYADELVEKATSALLRDRNVSWTFQGRLQSNKINRLAPHVSLWQTIDSVERAEALAKRRPDTTVLLQVNLTQADGRSGIDVTNRTSVDSLIGAIRRLPLRLVGVMGVGPDPSQPGVQAKDSLDAFKAAIEVADRCALPVRSLGMSADYPLAIQAGATMIRLGSTLFGSR